jgi:CRISPR-associated endoribonuclease Cas6
MLASLTVYLFPVEKAILPPTMGHYIHAAFLDIARQMDSKIAERLHLNQPYKPFTVSPLQGKFDKQGKGKLFIRAGTECWVRFTIMDDYLLSAVVKFFTEGESSMLRLGDSMFQVTKVTTNGGGTDGNWSACTTFEELFDNASPSDKLNVRFYSPTAFKVHNGNTNSAQSHVFPDPLHCFQSWLRKWNALSAIQIDEDPLLSFVQQYIQFSRYSVKTRIMNFGGYKQLGFVGDCEYRFVGNSHGTRTGSPNGESKELLKQAEALASFAFYCGTGYKTTMGMGQTRKQDSARTGEA